MDPQLNSVWVIRALRSDEEWAGYPDTKWIRTADVIKPMQANILADKGMPTGIYRKQLFSSDYECFAEPIKVKGNIIRFRVAGLRSGTISEYQLTLTVKNHATLAEAKQALIERVEIIYKHINWDLIWSRLCDGVSLTKSSSIQRNAGNRHQNLASGITTLRTISGRHPSAGMKDNQLEDRLRSGGNPFPKTDTSGEIRSWSE